MAAWTAKWIWMKGTEFSRNFYLCVRKTFAVPKDLQTATLRITADARYVLFVNGQRIGNGPVRGWQHSWFYDTYDLTPYLRVGERNAIGVLVIQPGEANFQYPLGRGGLLAQLDMVLKQGRKISIGTDRTWRVAPHPAYDRRTPRIACQQGFVEHYDATKGIRHGANEWATAGFDDSQWGIYLVLVQPYTRNFEMWRCPSYSGVYTVRICFWVNNAPGCDNRPVEPPPLGRVITGWLANSDVMGGWDNYPPKPLTRVQEPAGTVLLAENDNWPPREGALNYPPDSLPWTGYAEISPCRWASHATYHSRWGVQPSRSSPTAGWLGAHHMEGLNLTFADGHAKWHKVFPEDCAAWVPAMPKGVAKVSDPAVFGCNPSNQPGEPTPGGPIGNWCGGL